ncbi:MAG: hypothetical protein ACLTR6_05700 [Clostridium fessum]
MERSRISWKWWHVLAKEAMADYLHAFKTIEFAVYCPPRDDTNFKVFKRVMGAY